MPDANLSNEFAKAIIIRNNRELIDTIAGVRLVSHKIHRFPVILRVKWGELVGGAISSLIQKAKSPCFDFFSCDVTCRDHIIIVSSRKNVLRM